MFERLLVDVKQMTHDEEESCLGWKKAFKDAK
jgi:hypothetical protein